MNGSTRSFGKNRVVIIEDDKILRDSFTYIVNTSERFVVVGAYEQSEDAMSELGRTRPEIILMDIELPGISGVEATLKIKEIFPSIEIIIVSAFEDSELVFGALKSGASGYITKSSNYLQLISAMNEIIDGGAPMSSRIAKMVIHNFHLNPLSPLTKREKQVLTLMSGGKTYSQISSQLFVSPQTIKTHIRNIYEKLRVNKKSDAIEYATRNRWL